MYTKLTHFFFTFNILVGYPILGLSLAGLLIYLPDLLILSPVFLSSIFNWFSDVKTLEIESIPLVEYLTLDSYFDEEYKIYKNIFVGSGKDSSEQINILQARLQPVDLISINTRSQEDLVNSYIQKFLIECHGNPKDFTWAKYILYFFNQEANILRLQFTLKGEIPTLTFEEFLPLYPQALSTERENLKLRLSVVDYRKANDIEWESWNCGWCSDTARQKSELQYSYAKKNLKLDEDYAFMSVLTEKTTEYEILVLKNAMAREIEVNLSAVDTERLRQNLNQAKFEKLEEDFSKRRQKLDTEFNEEMEKLLRI